jgi:hypothetical protein
MHNFRKSCYSVVFNTSEGNPTCPLGWQTSGKIRTLIKNIILNWELGCTPVIPGTWEAEARGSQVGYREQGMGVLG